MMKPLLKLSAVVLAGLLSVNAGTVQAQRGPTRYNGFAAAVFLTINGNAQAYNVHGGGADLIIPNGPSYTGNYLGTFVQNSASLWFMGSEVKTYKQSGANVCGVSVAYGVSPDCLGCASLPSTEMELHFKADCDNGVFADGYGPCSFGDQKWRRDDTGVDLTNRPPGTYAMSICYNLKGSDYNPLGCEGAFTWGAINNGNGYYSTGVMASFKIVAPTAGRPADENTTGLTAISNDALASLSVYPSPATSTVTIDPVNFNEGEVQMEVTNIQGSVAKKVAVTYIKGQSIELDMSSYVAGMYFVRLSQDSKTAVAKVVKQ